MIRSPTPLLNTKLKELPKNTTKRDLTFKQRSRRESQRSELRILVESTVQMVYQRVCCRQPPHLIG